jgi:hypothetical protein
MDDWHIQKHDGSHSSSFMTGLSPAAEGSDSSESDSSSKCSFSGLSFDFDSGSRNLMEMKKNPVFYLNRKLVPTFLEVQRLQKARKLLLRWWKSLCHRAVQVSAEVAACAAATE